MTSLTVLLAVPLLLLPGYAWVLVSGLDREICSLEKVVISFVLSVCFSSLLAAALSLVTPSYLALSVAISLVGALLVIGAYSIKRFQSSWKRPEISLEVKSRALYFSMFIYAVTILGLFWSEPYYPQAEAHDVLAYVQATNAIIGGKGTSMLLHVDFPSGFYFTAAVFQNLGQIGTLQSLRMIAALVLFAIPPLFYLCAREVLENSVAAGMAVLVAAFAMPADAIHLIQPLFPNLIADAIVLSVVLLVFQYMKKPSSSLGLTLGLLGISGTFMHSSFLILVGILWAALPVVFVRCRQQSRNYFKAVLCSTVGLVIFGVFAWFSFAGNLGRISSAYIVLGSPSAYARLAEFLRSLLVYLGPINVAVIICAAAIPLKYRNGFGRIFVFLWLLVMIIGGLLSDQEYRFVLFAMLPGSLLVASMRGSPLQRLAVAKDALLAKLSRIIIVLIFLVLIVSGFFPSFAAAAYNPSGRIRQIAVYESMTWLENSGCKSSGVASVGLSPDYQYLPALTSVRYVTDFMQSRDYILQKSTSLDFHCIAVQNQYVQEFSSNASFQEKYQNEYITVFAIA